MHDVFISYSSKDWEYVYQIRQHLLNSGLSCWMAPDSIPAGSNYTREIPIGIRDCQVFLVIVSGNSVRSRWVLKELDTAINKGKHVIPFVVESCSLSDEFEFLLSGCQCKYASSPNALLNLANQIRVFLGRNPVPAVPVATQPGSPAPQAAAFCHTPAAHRPVAPPVPKKRKPWAPIIGIALAALLLFGAGSLIKKQNEEKKYEASYRMAETLLDDKDYAGAIEIFQNLNGYKDSDTRALQLLENQAAYDAAVGMLENRQFAESAQAFRALGNYRDSAEYAALRVPYAEAGYQMNCATEAEAAEAVALYEQAASLYLSLGDYKDSAQLAGQSMLKAAEILFASENYEQALSYLEYLNESDGNVLRNMYVNTCADSAFLLDMVNALEIWLDSEETDTSEEEIDLAWQQVALYQQAHFDDSKLPVLLEDFRTALNIIQEYLDASDSAQNYAGLYHGIYRLCNLAEILQQDYQALEGYTALQEFFIGRSDYYNALYTLETSFANWWASNLSDAETYDSGNSYTVYTNDTGYSFDLIAVIYYLDADHNKLDQKELTIHVSKGATVSIPLNPENIAADDYFSWILLWDFANIS